MKSYWAKFTTGNSACVEAKDEQAAKQLAAELSGREVVSVTVLPYPAEPRLNHYEHEFSDGYKSACPSFCFSPEQCKGRTSCPKSYACSE